MRAQAGSVSVVIASPRGGSLLAACLSSVLAQARAHDAPVIVACTGEADDVLARLGDNGSTVVPVAVPPGSSLPQVRGAGLSAVGTAWAALIEDHCVAGPGWLASLCEAAAEADLVGGRMGNAQRDRIVDWAAYFSEYGFFAGSSDGSGATLATGANVLYGPRALPLAARWAADGLWEDVIHARLIAAGCRLSVTPTAEMLQNQRYEIASFCRDRFQHGFDYARVRAREQPDLGRWVRACTSPLLPFVLARRLSAKVAPPDRRVFLRALPLTVLFLSAWSFGEMMGYVRGPAL